MNQTLLRTRFDQLLGNLDFAHDAYYKVFVFGGPSLYFHIEALHASRKGEVRRFAEMSYAMLTAWGMDRMGPGGSKMEDFACFLRSIRGNWLSIQGLREVEPTEMDESKWETLRQSFRSIHCMASRTSIVGNSKVLAHAIPNLVPPVDREYTLRFLRGNKNVRNNIDAEWQTLRTLLEGFFYPVLSDERFLSKAFQWENDPSQFQWDTSRLKIVDNLIIGILKAQIA